MSGTKTGGLKAAATNLAKDPDFYKKIGAKGGKNGTTGGFAANPELARLAGAKGGRNSRRNRIKLSGEIESENIIPTADQRNTTKWSIWGWFTR